MNTKIIALLLASAILVACGSPTAYPEYETEQAVQPTWTPYVIVVTNTPENTATVAPTPTVTNILVVNTSVPSLPKLTQPSNFDKARADKNDGTSPLLIENHSGSRITVTITSPLYASYTVPNRLIVFVPPWTTYTYEIAAGDKEYTGLFSVGNEDKHTLTVEKNAVYFVGP